MSPQENIIIIIINPIHQIQFHNKDDGAQGIPEELRI